MKRFSILLVMLLAVGAMKSSDAWAGPIHWDLDPDSGYVLGGLNTSTSLKYPGTFITSDEGYAFLAVTVTSNGAGNGALTDSFVVALQRFVDLGGDTQKWPDSTSGSWMNVVALTPFDPTIQAGKSRYMTQDSINLGFFPLGGLCRLIMYKGGGPTLDTINANYDLDVLFEQKGKN